MMGRATLIYNPRAGPADLTATIKEVAAFWRRRDFDVSLQPTRAPGHARLLAQAAAEAGHRLVLAAGGDGTLGEVADGLVGSATVLAPLPSGTANSFARELNLPRPDRFHPHRLQAAARALADGRVHPMDLGFTTGGDRPGHHWLLWAGAGADGHLVHTLEPRPGWSRRLGRAGYALQAAAAAPAAPPLQGTVWVDGRPYSGRFSLVLLSNCRLYAGGLIQLAPHARLDDGVLDIWLFHGAGPTRLLSHVTRAWRGRHLASRHVTHLRGAAVVVEADPPVPCQTDGEPAGYTPLQAGIRPGGLQLLVPAAVAPQLFGHPGQPL